VQDKRLVQLFRYEELDQDNVLDELNKLRKERERDKDSLEKYCWTRERIASLWQAEIRLAVYCEQAKSGLDTASFEDRSAIGDMLATKVSATPERVAIEGVITLDLGNTQSSDEPPNLLTTARTLGCLICLYYNHATRKESLSIIPQK
jgi:hypothetical protein